MPTNTLVAMFDKKMAEQNKQIHKTQQENPFLKYKSILTAHYSTAEKLRVLALHLYNDSYICNISSIMRSADEDHKYIAFEMLDWYAKYGERCPVFMKICQELINDY